MPSNQQRAVFLDRDGVINRAIVHAKKPYAPRTLADFRLLPRTKQAVGSLKRAGLLLIVVTNQPDIGNGLVDCGTVQAMHERLRDRLPVDDIKVCPHKQNDGCSCRKPAPGMLLEAASEWGVALHDSFMVGDRDSDVLAGRSAGCRTLFIDRAYAKETGAGADYRVKNLAAATVEILRQLT